jgi:hypothetical protein
MQQGLILGSAEKLPLAFRNVPSFVSSMRVSPSKVDFLIERRRNESRSRQQPKLGITGGMGSEIDCFASVLQYLALPVSQLMMKAKRIQDNDREIQAAIIFCSWQGPFPGGGLTELKWPVSFSATEAFSKSQFDYTSGCFQFVRRMAEKTEFALIRSWKPPSVRERCLQNDGQIATVITPHEERIERHVAGNRFTREQIIERIKNQIDDASKNTRF